MAENGLLDEIFVALGFKVDDKKVKQFDNNIKTTVSSLKRMVVIAAGAVTALDRLTNSLLKANQAYISFNQQTGLSIDSMNRLVGAGMLANYSLTPEAMMNSIQALQSNLAAISIGQGNIAPFQLLGISPVGKEATQIIEEWRIALQGVDEAMAVNIIQQMGLSPEMLSLLRLSSEEMNRLNAAAQQFMLTGPQRQALNKFAMDMRLVHMEMAYLKDKVLISIAPHLIKFLSNFNKILELMFQYKEVLAWLGVGGVAAIMKMDKAVKILGITINATFGKWLAALTAIYLILEDLAVWRSGGQSLIGDLYEWNQRGGNRDINAKTIDQMHEELFDKPRTGLQKYLDWWSQGGFIGTLGKSFGGNNPQYDMYKKMLQARSGGAVGNVSATQNLQQNNYITVDNNASSIAQTTTDLMFTMAQADRRK